MENTNTNPTSVSPELQTVSNSDSNIIKVVILVMVVIFLAVTGFILYQGGRQKMVVTPKVIPTIVLPSVTANPINQEQISPTPSVDSTVTTFKNEMDLTVSQPVDKSTVTTATVTVSGKTIANADVTVNDKVLKADKLGNFFTTVTLDEGENTVFVSAIDDQGNYAEKNITVTYNLEANNTN